MVKEKNLESLNQLNSTNFNLNSDVDQDTKMFGSNEIKEPYLTNASSSTYKVKKTAKIRNRYNQVPRLSQDTKWESNKTTINITNKSQEVSPSLQVTTRQHNRHKSMTTQDINNTNDPQKIEAPPWNVKYFTGGLKPVSLFPTSPLVQM